MLVYTIKNLDTSNSSKRLFHDVKTKRDSLCKKCKTKHHLCWEKNKKKHYAKTIYETSDLFVIIFPFKNDVIILTHALCVKGLGSLIFCSIIRISFDALGHMGGTGQWEKLIYGKLFRYNYISVKSSSPMGLLSCFVRISRSTTFTFTFFLW